MLLTKRINLVNHQPYPETLELGAGEDVLGGCGGSSGSSASATYVREGVLPGSEDDLVNRVRLFRGRGGREQDVSVTTSFHLKK